MSILTISGSPSAQSRSARLLGHVRAQLERAGESADHLDLRGLPADALLGAQVSNPAIADAVARVEGAAVVILATPVYKAAYSGLLKTFLDLLPQSGLRDKVVLPIATGGSLAHTLAIDYALRPVLTALAARSILPGIFAVDSQIVVADDGVVVDPQLQQRLDDGVERVHQALALARHPAVAQVIVSSRSAVRATFQTAGAERMRCLA
ncbi:MULTISPECIES: NADPH-dependent FMN reductase [Ralstonia]|jgi:FMN reductase|uniref:FMN reductase (NADPH) n=1 Tax=Ralstonia flaminis TaxID=3058597 RepID=A0ABM9K426_9RALS|nr:MULTISPECIES: NADPH-dependent FMN reductase [unclassified Ralstonia]CAJ0812448.1 FMN reductase (NADPH) [Ralstonia sp. LMG 18101]